MYKSTLQQEKGMVWNILETTIEGESRGIVERVME